ncbi:polyketide synthase [Diplodia corticola]|uniref:Polyketide synthase n=1 Tax=Diplodia corticola TaxID=236234 RepID=A0A1J9RPL9_9PEZI|nr:polyketide synthase [Diplodia corticola]OJD30407.1 polyketide synthase [Diplodia corticola]
MYRVTGNGDFAIANHVSYEFDWKNRDLMMVRTGVLLIAGWLQEACQVIYSGDCDSAVVSGTNLILTPTMTVALAEQDDLSSTGSCKSFDTKTNGYVRGEAVNAILVERLSMPAKMAI